MGHHGPFWSCLLRFLTQTNLWHARLHNIGWCVLALSELGPVIDRSGRSHRHACAAPSVTFPPPCIHEHLLLWYSGTFPSSLLTDSSWHILLYSLTFYLAYCTLSWYFQYIPCLSLLTDTSCIFYCVLPCSLWIS
jgi:hypothetical protein